MSDQSAPGSKPSHPDPGKADPGGSLFLRHASPSLTAVLIDAGFFLRRARRLFGEQSPEDAALAFKRQVSQIVLVSGDSDFVPAAKQARREGVDFVLDPMWATIRPDLHEHVDGLRSVCPRPSSRGQA